MPFTKRAQDALENALHDRESTYEILSKIALLEQHVGSGGGGEQEGISFSQIEGVAAVDQLPTTGLVIDQHTSLITQYSDDLVIMFDCALSNWHMVTIGGDRILAIKNVSLHQEFTIIIGQDPVGNHAISRWFPGIRWAYENEPTLTKRGDKLDMFRFKQLSDGVYLGMIYGQTY